MSLSDYFRNVSARLFQIHSHNIVIHIEPVANVIIALSELVQSHPLIEVDSLIVPVDVQFQSAWRRMIAPNPIDCILKQEPSHVMSLIFGQHVNLLQVINVHVLFRFILLGVGQWLDRHVADRLTVNLTYQVSVVLLSHLLAQTVGRVHHVHHVIVLLWSYDVLVSQRESPPGY